MKKTLLITSILCLLFASFPAMADTYLFSPDKSKYDSMKNDLSKMSTSEGLTIENQSQGSSVESAVWYLEKTMIKGTFPNFNWDSNASKGIQFGTGNAPVATMSVTIAGIPGEITSVKVNSSGASSTNAVMNVAVGGTSFTYGGNSTVSLTTTATDYAFTGVGTGNVVLSYSQTSSKAIYIKSVEITFDPSTGPQKEDATIEWGDTPESLQKGETLDLSTLLTVTPEAAAAAVIYSSSDEEIASVEGSILSALKRGTVNVTAMITNSDTYKDTPRVTFTLNVLDPDATFKIYKELTSLDNIGDGLDIIIVNEDLTKVMGNNVGNNINALDMAPESDGTYKIYDDDEMVGRLRLESAGTIEKTEGEGDSATTAEVDVYSFKLGEQGYLYAASSSSNYLKVEEELSDDGKALITFLETEVEGEPETQSISTTVKFQGTNTRNELRYNSSSNLFACYASGQNPVKIYAIEPEAPVIPEIAAPVIAPEGGDVKIGDLVTLSCETEDAEISYKIGEGEFVAYTEPFALNEAGEVTVTAVAKVGEYSSDETTATFTVTKYDVTLEWSASSANCALSKLEDFVEPTLTVTPEEVASEVTYSSSTPAVATVDANGKVSPMVNGSTVITASFAGNDKYNAAEPASYTLTVSVRDGVMMISCDDADVEIFDLNGRKISAEGIEKGLYIVRENGKSSKVIVK